MKLNGTLTDKDALIGLADDESRWNTRQDTSHSLNGIGNYFQRLLDDRRREREGRHSGRARQN